MASGGGSSGSRSGGSGGSADDRAGRSRGAEGPQPLPPGRDGLLRLRARGRTCPDTRSGATGAPAGGRGGSGSAGAEVDVSIGLILQSPTVPAPAQVNGPCRSGCVVLRPFLKLLPRFRVSDRLSQPSRPPPPLLAPLAVALSTLLRQLLLCGTRRHLPPCLSATTAVGGKPCIGTRRGHCIRCLRLGSLQPQPPPPRLQRLWWRRGCCGRTRRRGPKRRGIDVAVVGNPSTAPWP